MEIKPIRRLIKPKYPDYYETIRSPKLLKRCIPLSWKCKSIILGALTAFVMAGCSSTGRKQVKSKITTSQLSDVKSENHQKQLQIDSAAEFVAPVFVHGDGSAATGCDVMASPVFISESEAAEIIEDELLKAGIRFPEKEVNKPVFKIKKLYDYNPIEYKSDVPPEKERKEYSLQLDNFNPKTGFGFEFVSALQSDEMSEKNYGYTVSLYHMKSCAQHLNKQLTQRKTGKKVAVFYDPVSYPDDKKLMDIPDIKEWIDTRHEMGRKESEVKLREQVKDFIKWAKKNGVLDKIKSR